MAKLLSGGNPQIAKGEGDAPVRAYVAALPGWKRAAAKRIDGIIVRTVPGVRKAVKWNSPFYGVEGRGWFLAVHAFTHYLKVTFFRGTSLRPLPPRPSKHKDVRSVDIREGELDDKQLAAWVKQAAALPGWDPGAENTQGNWREKVIARVRALIHEADPTIVEERKWRKPSNPDGVPVWSRDGIVCTGEMYKNAVKLTFARGADLPDRSRLFNASLEGSTRRAIDIHEGEDLDARAFKALVKAAVASNRAAAKKR